MFMFSMTSFERLRIAYHKGRIQRQYVICLLISHLSSYLQTLAFGHMVKYRI